VGYSFFQAVALYGEASSAARDSPALASNLSPLDGVLVPTFGALYLAATLLFPFVAIRTLGREKESGALALLVQLPYRVPTQREIEHPGADGEGKGDDRRRRRAFGDARREQRDGADQQVDDTLGCLLDTVSILMNVGIPPKADIRDA
jgi:hypothetical protein